MRYVEDPEINEKVSEIIEELKRELVSRFHPKSIILIGSFGRGEATVIEKDGKLNFLSDCEVILIPYKWIFNRSKLDEFEQEFYQRTGLKIEIWGFTTTLYLLFPFLNKRIKPTIASYELKYGSKVIYGKDYLKKIPDFKPEDIPLWEGIRLLFNRMAEALKYFSLEEPTVEMIFWTDKIVLACQDALLLTVGRYHPSYKKRNELFKEVFPKLQIDIPPDFLRITEEATKRKLSGKVNNIDPVDYWFSISGICDKIFRYVIKTEFGFTFTDYLDFQEKYIKHRRRFSLFSNLIRYLKVLTLCKHKKFLPLKLKVDIDYLDLIYSIIPIAFFELCGKNPDSMYLKRCLEVLRHFGVNCKPQECLKAIIEVWELLVK